MKAHLAWRNTATASFACALCLSVLTACSESPNDKEPECAPCSHYPAPAISACPASESQGKYRNLVFQGGGVKGIAYAGALHVLQKKGYLNNIKRVAGTSAGAITATLVALGYNACEIEEFEMAVDYKDFEDGELFSDIFRLADQYGWYKGDYFQCTIECIVKQKTRDKRTTFAELNRNKNTENGFKDLYIVATDVTTRDTVTFSHESNEHKDAAIADVVRLSMSIPFFFRARTFLDHIYVDGGVLRNYPIDLFDNVHYRDPDDQDSCKVNEGEKKDSDKGVCINNQTLGFHLGSQRQSKYKIDNLLDFTKELLGTLLAQQVDALCLNENNWARTVFINPHNIKTSAFDLSNQKKRALVRWGKNATKNYLDPDQVRPDGCPDFVIPTLITNAEK